MTEIEIMKKLFVALSDKEVITLFLKDGSSTTGCVNKFDGTNIFLGDEEILLANIVSIESTEGEPSRIVETQEKSIQQKIDQTIDFESYKSKRIQVRFLWKGVIEQDEGVLFDYKSDKLVLVTNAFKRVIDKNDIIEIAEVDDHSPDDVITNMTNTISDYSPNRFESALIAGEKELVESYLKDPALLESEGYSETEATLISKIATIQAPWKDDDSNRIHNQARRVFTYIKNRNQLAERLFHKCIESDKTAPKYKVKALSTLINIAGYESNEKLINLYYQYESVIINNPTLSSIAASTLTRVGEYDLARSIIDRSDPDIDFSEIMFSLSFHEKHRDYDFSTLPGLDSLDERVTLKELKLILALPNKASCIQLLSFYSNKQGRADSFFAILDLFLPYAKNEIRIVEAVSECLKQNPEDKYLISYLPQFPLLWLDNELSSKYLQLFERTEADNPTIKRLKNQCQRAIMYKNPNNLEASIIQGNWNSFEAQRENDSILYSFGYSVEEARYIRAFDIETIKYGNKPAIERLLLFEGNKNHVAESSAAIDFLRAPEAVCKQLFPILLNDKCADLVYELYNYSSQITKRLVGLKKDYLKALLLLNEREEYWKQIKDDWMNLGLDSEMLVEAKTLAEEHGEDDLADLFAMFAEKKPFNEFEMAIINGNVSRLRALITDADFLLGSGYTTEEIRLIQESVRQKPDFTSDDSLSIANRLYVFQKNKNRSAEFYYKLALRENTELAASGLFSIYASESRFNELCSLYESKLRDAALVIEIPGNKKAYLNALFQTKQYEKFYQLWETDKELFAINPLELLIVLLETNASSEAVEEIINDQLSIDSQDKELITRCLELFFSRENSEQYIETLFNKAFPFFDEQDVNIIKEFSDSKQSYKWTIPCGNGIRGLITPLTCDELREWINYLFELFPNSESRIKIIENIIKIYENNSDEFFNLVNELVEILSGEKNVVIPETLSQYRYPKFKDEQEKAIWLDKKISSLTAADESTFDLVCELSKGIEEKSALRKYLYSISAFKLPYAVKYINVITSLINDSLEHEGQMESRNLIEFMNCLHNQMTVGHIAPYDIVILYKVYIKLQYFNYAYIAYCALHDSGSLDDNVQNEVESLYDEHLANLNLSIFEVVTNGLRKNSLKSIDQFFGIWKDYLRISEDETKALEELKDYYNQSEKWSKEALESLSKHLICGPSVPMYWRLLKLYYADGPAEIKCNIMYHQALVENGTFIPVLLFASDSDLFNQAIDILAIIIRTENPTSFEKDKESISIVIHNHPNWFEDKTVACSFMQSAHDNYGLKKGLLAWTYITELTLDVAILAGIEKQFFELYEDDLENIIPIINEKLLCELILTRSIDEALIHASYDLLQKSTENIPYRELLNSIIPEGKLYDISPIQYDVIRIIRNNNGDSIDEFSLYEYYVTSVAEGKEDEAVEVFKEIEKFYPDLEVLDDVKKYETVAKAIDDNDIVTIYNNEFEKLSSITVPVRMEKVISNMIPAEMYINSKGIKVESVIEYALKSLAGDSATRIRTLADKYGSLDNVFDSIHYPGLASIFMKCSFLRKWKEFIEYNLESPSINDIIRSDSTVHEFLEKKTYDVLKSIILAIVDSEEKSESIVDRADAMAFATGSIKPSKEKLLSIQTMGDGEKETLRRIFSLRIESASLRGNGIIGSCILKIPHNEDFANYLDMLGTRNITALFDNNICFSTLMKLPKDTALVIAQKYADLFYQGSNNVFARFLHVRSGENSTHMNIENPFDDSFDKCEGIRERYIKYKKGIDESEQDSSDFEKRRFVNTKAEYLYLAIVNSSEDDLEIVNPSKIDYLSVLTYLFNYKTIDEMRDYIRKLDTSAAIPVLCGALALLEQYNAAYTIALQIKDTEWRISTLRYISRCMLSGMRFGIVTPSERQLKYTIDQQAPYKSEFVILRNYPMNRTQNSAYVEKMEALRSFCIGQLKYLSSNGFDIPWVHIDKQRTELSLKRYLDTRIQTTALGQRPMQNQYSREIETVEKTVDKEHIANLVRAYPNVPVAENARLAGATLEECIGALKYIIEVKYNSQSLQDVLQCRDTIRWIYIKLMDKEGYDRENFNHVLEFISEKDVIVKQQWNIIYSYLVQYFSKITDMQQLSRIVENDINNLRNVGKVSNPTIRFLGNADINSWRLIIDVLNNIASINPGLPENEQESRLAKYRSMLNGESWKKSAFDQVINSILRLINEQIMHLHRNPEIIISIPGEKEGNLQNILWESDNDSGKLYAVISNTGGADCYQVELVSTINMTRRKKYAIKTIYSGEKIPFSESFSKSELIDGKVTWNLEVSYFDSEKGQTISIQHEHKAFIQTGGEPLRLGKIDTGMPARGQNFVGRKRELTILRSRYSEASQIPSMLIRGLKRSGKSSIIIRFAEEIKKKNKLIVASVDGQIVGGRIKMAFFDKVLESIMINYGRNDEYKDIFDNQFDEFRNKWERKLDIAEWMSYLDSFYYELSRLFNKKILIILDEMESVFYSHRFESVEQEESLYAILRALIQNPENYVSFIFCGSDTLLTSCLEQRRESQMFQTLHPLEVGQMTMGDIQDIFRLQSEKYDIQFTREAVDMIWKYTHGLVWYAKLIGYLVIDNIFAKELTVRKDVNSSDIVTAVQMLLNGEIGSDKFDLVDASLNTPRVAIVHAMANLMPDYNKQLSVDEILHEIQEMKNNGYINPRNAEEIPDMSEKDVKSHLDFLEKMQFVDSNASKTRYLFAAELYRLFFRSDKRLHLFEERR